MLLRHAEADKQFLARTGWHTVRMIPLPEEKRKEGFHCAAAVLLATATGRVETAEQTIDALQKAHASELQAKQTDLSGQL